MTHLRSENPAAPQKFYYHIDLDERGEFEASVRTRNDDIVYELHGFEVEDGFMRHNRDIAGLESYLKSLKIIPEESSIYKANPMANPSLWVVERDGAAIGRMPTSHEAMRYARALSIEDQEAGRPEIKYTVRKLRYDNPRLHSAKWRRCVRDVEASGAAVSPYAVCTRALGARALRGSNPAPEWHEARARDLNEIAGDYDAEDSEFLRRKAAEHTIMADMPEGQHAHGMMVESEDLGEPERAAHRESMIAEAQRVRTNPRGDWEFVGAFGSKGRAVKAGRFLMRQGRYRQIRGKKNRSTGTWELWGRMGSNPPRGEIDYHAARNLYLFAVNTGSLYNELKSILKNLARKRKKGIYDPNKAVKLWRYWIDNAAKLYKKEFGVVLNVPTRTEAARQAEEKKSGSVDDMVRELYGSNPRGVPAGAVKIYDKIEQIKATKGRKSLYPGEGFYHNFKGASKGSIYGLQDGSLLVKGNRPLWARFEQT